MKLVDVNVLLYVVNEDAAQHEAVVGWWKQALAGDETIGLPWAALLGFLRVATNPRIFAHPIEPVAALRVIDDWLGFENTFLAREKDGHWETLRMLLTESGTAGNLTTDAHLAALAICHGAVLVSCDNDFARFKGLRWENPLT